MLRILFANRIKHFYSVENLVQKPVGEQDKTHEFSLNLLKSAVVNCALPATKILVGNLAFLHYMDLSIHF